MVTKIGKLLVANYKAGLAVALISIPLSISLAVASGATPLSGIITAIWAGLIAALFGGSHYNIIGPTGALSGLVATYAFAHGADSIALMTILGGLFILVAYLFKFERYLIFVPSSVVHGFTLGVACIIGLGQLGYALGLKGITQHERLVDNVLEIVKHSSGTSLVSVGIFLATLFLLFFLRWFVPRIPGIIAVAPLGILIGYLSKSSWLPVSLETLGDKFSDISFKLFVKPEFLWHPDVLQTAAIIAFIAIIETMFSARVADNITRTKHNARKEMLGLGLANIVSGLTGGIPATAALARTAVNIKAYANHKMSGILNALFIAILSFFLLQTFRYIPLAVIAAILMQVAIQMVESVPFYSFFKYERVNFWISLLVAFITVYKNPIVGVLLGASLSLVFLIEKIAQGQCDIKVNKLGGASDRQERVKELDDHTEILIYSLRGKLCYINGRAHVVRLEKIIKKYKYIILNLHDIYFIDLDGIEALDEIIALSESSDQKCALVQIDAPINTMLENMSSGYKKLKNKGLIFNELPEAVAYFRKDHTI